MANPLAGGSRFRAVIHGLIVAGWGNEVRDTGTSPRRGRNGRTSVSTQAGKEHGAQRSGPRPGNEVLPFWAGQDGVLSRFPALRSPQPVSLASPQPNGSAASNLDGTGLGGPGRRAFQQVPGSRRKPGHRERQCPQRVSGALPIRREHPEMVGESIVQGFLIASIILRTFGSVVPAYV